MSRQVFLKGALALSISAFLSKLLGLFYVIPLKHYAGDEGLALYQLVFPIYNTILVLSISGIPIALSKLISENLAVQNTAEVSKIMKSTFQLMIVISLSGFMVFFFGSRQIASWIGNLDTQLSIQAMAFAMLLVPFVALLRGYFYGYQRMKLSALSQVLEQFIRVSFMIFIVYWLMVLEKEIGLVAAGAALGSFIGLTLSLILLLYVYLNSTNFTKVYRDVNRGAGLVYGWKILALSIPVSLSMLMIPLLGLIDSISIINLLEASGFTESTATKEFGVYSRGVPIVQFSSFYATGLAIAAVPALASVRSTIEKREHIFRSIQITVLAGVPASIGMMVIAHPLNILFYGDANGSETLVVLSASTFFLSLAVTASGILQGVGKQIYPAMFLGIGVIAKIIGNLWLVGDLGIKGAAYSTLISYFVISLLCLWDIYHSLQKNIGIGHVWIKWILPSLFMAVGLLGILVFLPELTMGDYSRVHSLFIVFVLMLVGVSSYTAGLFLFRIVTMADVKRHIKRLIGNSKKSGV